MVDLKRARLVAWTFAEIAHNQEYKSAGYHVITAETGYGLANTLRDLVDAVEELRWGKSVFDHPLSKEVRRLTTEVKKLTEQRDTFAQDNINLRGGFYGPRAEIESHMQAEIEQLRQKLLDNNIPVE